MLSLVFYFFYQKSSDSVQQKYMCILYILCIRYIYIDIHDIGSYPKQWYFQRSTLQYLQGRIGSMATDGPLTPHPAALHQETDPKADEENGDTGQPVEVQPGRRGGESW